jgi:hypothetical protein
MLGVCLAAVFALSAVAFVASPAMASKACDVKCEEAKERAKVEKKVARTEETGVGDPYLRSSWGEYKGCPYQLYEKGEIENCFVGITAGGGKGGYFEYGNVKVPLSKSIHLQGGFTGAGSEIAVIPAANGRETLEAPPLPITGGIKLFTKDVQQSAQWPQALKESFKEAVTNHETAAFAKIEMAGNECFEVLSCLDTENLIFEEGTAFRLPLKVKVTAPWLETLKSGACYIGSDEHPIKQHLTTEGAGNSGRIEFNASFEQTFVTGSKLVDLHWHIEPASAPNGCGGEYEQYIDEALSIVLELQNSSRTGITVLKGNLHDGAASAVSTYGVESGELP